MKRIIILDRNNGRIHIIWQTQENHAELVVKFCAANGLDFDTTDYMPDWDGKLTWHKLGAV